MSNIKAARELENLRYLHRVEELNEQEQSRIQEIKSDAAARGILQSGPTNRSITEARVDKVRELIDSRIAIRKALVAEVPEFGAEHLLNDLQQELQEFVKHAIIGLRNSLAPAPSEVVSAAFERVFEQEILDLQARARRQIEMLKTEIALGLHKKAEQAFAASVHTGGGPAIVNLGTVYCNVQQVIGDVNNAGRATWRPCCVRLHLR